MTQSEAASDRDYNAFRSWEELYWLDKKKYPLASEIWTAALAHRDAQLESEEMLGIVAKTVMNQSICGLNIEKAQVLCCSKEAKALEGNDGYGKPLWRDASECDCLLTAKAAIEAIRKGLRG